jgi:hypothetical protein
MLEALELADPSMALPDKDGPQRAWDAAELLCETTGINFAKFKTQCAQMHIDFEDMPALDRKNCKLNLLRFYHELAKCEGLNAYPDVRAYAIGVFTFPVTTVFIECMFSAMKQNKSKGRASMLDDTCVAVIKARELETVLESDAGMPEPPLRLNWQRALNHNLPF